MQNFLRSIVYQKYLAKSIKVGYATRSLYASSGQTAEGVSTSNQRGRGSIPWGICTSSQNASDFRLNFVIRHSVRELMAVGFPINRAQDRSGHH